MKLIPRFPLLGGWNLTWDISYNVPTEDFLQRAVSGSEYRFEFRLGHLLHDLPTDLYELEVALPEGATIKDFVLDTFDFASKELILSYSYLDFVGRPTLKLKFNNFLGKIDKNAVIIVDYHFAQILMLVEPAYLVIGLMMLFGIYIFLSKFDFSFGSTEVNEEYNKKRIAAIKKYMEEQKRKKEEASRESAASGAAEPPKSESKKDTKEKEKEKKKNN